MFVCHTDTVFFVCPDSYLLSLYKRKNKPRLCCHWEIFRQTWWQNFYKTFGQTNVYMTYLALHFSKTQSSMRKSFEPPAQAAISLCLISASFWPSGLPTKSTKNKNSIIILWDDILQCSFGADTCRHAYNCNTFPAVTWPNEDILHWEHGGYRQHDIFTPESSSFEKCTGEIGRKGKLDHQTPKLGHVTSPVTKTQQ